MSKVTPIRPDDVIARRHATIPDFVIEAFNTCIAKAYANGAAVVYQDDVVAAVLLRARNVRGGRATDHDMDRDRVFRERWLDVEDLYRAQGWIVTYDKPTYSESHRASFTFKRAKQASDG